jgi:hypothetical protein
MTEGKKIVLLRDSIERLWKSGPVRSLHEKYFMPSFEIK